MTSARFINWAGTLRDLVWIPQPPLKFLRHLATLFGDVGRGFVAAVPARLCIDSYAYSFGDPRGWHFYTDLARQLLERPETACEDTRFYRFLKALRADSWTGMMSFHEPALYRSLPRLPYGSYPWGTYEWRRVELDPDRFYDRSVFRGRTSETGRTEYPEIVFGEDSAETEAILRRDFHKCRSLVRSFRNDGYRPLQGRFFLPTVGVLAAAGGDVRFLLKDGNHRVAVLAALGCDRIWVRIDTRRFATVREADAERWPWVRSGLLGVEQARRMFSLYFTLNGAERRHALLPEWSAP